MQNIPSPEMLFGEVEAVVPDNAVFDDIVAFLCRSLEEHKEVLYRGQTLRVMVSCETSRTDIETICRLFWCRGWQTSFLSCPPHPHQLCFTRPQFYGMPGRYGSIH